MVDSATISPEWHEEETMTDYDRYRVLWPIISGSPAASTCLPESPTREPVTV